MCKSKMWASLTVLLPLTVSLWKLAWSLTQEANVTCSAIHSTYIMQFYVVKNSDTVDLVYTLNMTDNSDTSIGQYDSNGNGIEGTGTTNDPYRLTITGNWSRDTGVTLDSVDETVKKVHLLAHDTIQLLVMVKSIYEAPFLDAVIFPSDKIYSLVCNFSETYNFLVGTGGLAVSGRVQENPNIVDGNARFEIIDANNGQPLVDVVIGQPVYLQVTLLNDSLATGVYAHSCYVCDTYHCNGTVTLPLIDANGCSSENIVSKFKSYPGGIVKTGTFDMFLIQNHLYMFFQCSVNFCYDSLNPRCSDLCASNGRRKRQALRSESGPDEVLTTWVTISIPENRDDLQSAVWPELYLDSWHAAKKQPAERTVIIVLAVLCCAAVVVMLTIAATVWYCRHYPKKSPCLSEVKQGEQHGLYQL